MEVLNVDDMEKKYRFFYHWVRATDKWSVHFRNTCTHAAHIKCEVPAESKMNKRQPLRVMRGWASEINICEDEDTIIIK